MAVRELGLPYLFDTLAPRASPDNPSSRAFVLFHSSLVQSAPRRGSTGFGRVQADNGVAL